MTHNTEVEESIKRVLNRIATIPQRDIDGMAYVPTDELVYEMKESLYIFFKDFHHQLQKAEQRGEERMKRAQGQTDEYYKLRLQKARHDGYNAGLADGTGKPLLAIEQMQQKAREEERLIVKKAIENINKVDAWYDHDLATLEDHHVIKMARGSYDDLMEWLTPKNEKSSNKN